MSLTSTWEEALTALEQWVHQVEAVLLSPEPLAVPPAPDMPQGAVPAALTLRAVAVHTAMTAAVQAGSEQRLRLQQQAAYGATYSPGGPTT